MKRHPNASCVNSTTNRLMKTTILAILAFFTICACSAIISWLAGYDFNRRGDDVAFTAFMTIMFGAIAAGLTATARRS